jgi:peptidylprolyl isomerase
LLWTKFVAGALLALGVGLAANAQDANWRTPDPDNLLLMSTTKGDILIELYPELAPLHVDRIKELSRTGFYDGLAFHRVIDDFMAQGGDPKGDGSGGSDKPDVKGEFSFRRDRSMTFVDLGIPGSMRLGFIGAMPVATQPNAMMSLSADGRALGNPLHCPGVASMARANDPDSANSQFFLMRAYRSSLDNKYSAWGRILTGQNVVMSLQVGEPPETPDRITRVRVVGELAQESRPQIEVLRTDGPQFRAMVDARLAAGQSIQPCALEIPTRTPS